MVHGDIKAHNFLIDPETLRVTIIDFGGISALPRLFISYALHRTRDTFIAGINKVLGWERSNQHLAMEAAAWIYWLISNDEFGKPHICLVLDFRTDNCYRPRQGWFPTAER